MLSPLSIRPQELDLETRGICPNTRGILNVTCYVHCCGQGVEDFHINDSIKFIVWFLCRMHDWIEIHNLLIINHSITLFVFCVECVIGLKSTISNVNMFQSHLSVLSITRMVGLEPTIP